MDQLGESIRKLILAGIGAAAVTKEKGESMLHDLVKKGELTVEQGKVLNEELKRNVKEAIRDNVTVHVVTPSDDLMSAVDDMDDDALAALKERIRAAEESVPFLRAGACAALFTSGDARKTGLRRGESFLAGKSGGVGKIYYIISGSERKRS